MGEKASRRYLPRVARAEPLRASPAPQHGVKSCGHRRHGPGHNVRRPAASPLAILSPRLCAHRSSRDETIEGTVFTHDSTAGVVVIEQKGAGDKSTYRMLRSSAIKGLEVLAEPADQSQWAAAGGNEAELPVVDLEVTRARTQGDPNPQPNRIPNPHAHPHPHATLQAVQARYAKALAKGEDDLKYLGDGVSWLGLGLGLAKG